MVRHRHRLIAADRRFRLIAGKKTAAAGDHFLQRPPLATLQCALPDHADAPAAVPKLLPDRAIPIDVAGDLVSPELCAALRPLEQVTAMAVPEAAVDEQHCPPARENKVGTPW